VGNFSEDFEKTLGGQRGELGLQKAIKVRDGTGQSFHGLGVGAQQKGRGGGRGIKIIRTGEKKKKFSWPFVRLLRTDISHGITMESILEGKEDAVTRRNKRGGEKGGGPMYPHVGSPA